MKRLAGITAAAVLLAAGGQATVWAQGGKTPTYPVVRLNVAIEPTMSTGEPTKITGVGAQPYVNGAPDGTTANIDKYGNLIISFGRPVHFEYATTPGLVSGAYDDSYISTLGQTPGTPLQNLIDDGSQSQCIKLNWQYNVSGGFLRHGFNRGFVAYPDVPDTTTSYAVVTRTGDMWVVEPAFADCAGYSNPESVALVFSQVSRKGKWENTYYGYHSLPFRLTLTRQP